MTPTWYAGLGLFSSSVPRPFPLGELKRLSEMRFYKMTGIRVSIAGNLQEYLAAIRRVTNSQWVFRGHSLASYELVPGLFRTSAPSFAASWKALENILLREFMKHATPHLESSPGSVVEWLAVAQHHGLPTRLLDWTRSPLVALHFAVEPHGAADLPDDAVVWQLRPPGELADDGGVSHIESWQDAHDNDRAIEAMIYHPFHRSSRVSPQQGCFTLHCLPYKWDRFVPLEELYCDPACRSGLGNMVLVKTVIPRDKCRAVWLELHAAGINRYVLFPDLDGLSSKLRMDMLFRGYEERGLSAKERLR